MEDPSRVKLQQSMLRTQQLIDQLKEQRKMMKGELGSGNRINNPQTKHNLPETRVVNYYHVPNEVGLRSQQPPALQPIIVTPSIQQHKQTNTKSDMMEMMMIQNAQMHQVMMQQLMLSSIHPQPPQPSSRLQPDWKDLLMLQSDSRPPSVHHYHHSEPQSNLPPIQMVSAFPTIYTPVFAQVEPLKPPKAVRLRKPDHNHFEPAPRRRIVWTLPFPGPRALRRFRHAGYAVFFGKALQLRLEAPWRVPLKTPLNEEFLIAIRLKEAVAAIHHIYLTPDKKICKILKQTVSAAGHDLTAAITASRSRDHDQAFEDLAVFIENIVFEMTEIMPPGGVLGIQRKSTVYKMIQIGQHFPRGYFWQLEKDLLETDSALRQVTEYDVLVLLVGLFIGRALVTTLLLKPQDYSVTSQATSSRASQNLKMLATIFVYILRRVELPANSRTLQLPIPVELRSQLFDEVQMQPIYKRLQTSLDYAEQLIRGWAKEYFTRLSKVR